jgi:hypothetical protein
VKVFENTSMEGGKKEVIELEMKFLRELEFKIIN